MAGLGLVAGQGEARHGEVSGFLAGSNREGPTFDP